MYLDRYLIDAVLSFAGLLVVQPSLLEHQTREWDPSEVRKDVHA